MWSLHIDPLIAFGVLVATATTDAAYVMFTAAVVARRRMPAATWSSIWYLLSSFAVISYTNNWIYVAFAAAGSWIWRLTRPSRSSTARRRRSRIRPALGLAARPTCPPAPSGAGQLTVATAPLRISWTASPRSLPPSGLKRKTPSAPSKPVPLVSTGSVNRCDPCVRASAAASETAS